VWFGSPAVVVVDVLMAAIGIVNAELAVRTSEEIFPAAHSLEER
jgi:hypothetical protein